MTRNFVGSGDRRQEADALEYRRLRLVSAVNFVVAIAIVRNASTGGEVVLSGKVYDRTARRRAIPESSASLPL